MKNSLCNRHNQIKFLINQIKKELRLKDCDKGNIQHLLNDILAETREAKKSGQKMENRLKQYRSSIEDLGYVRRS